MRDSLPLPSRNTPRNIRWNYARADNRLDPFTYLDEILRVLPHWPRHRYLELAPKHWTATRARLRPEELAAPLSAFEIPAELAPPPPSDDSRPAA